ncbi:hypothetical protein BP6252_11882 [Coleophoma cylindrospora]|uniref:Uncharacterized protein n=1 Tax=Coleophoma cylindrospora TaxID=1849047 RepID=A0A3D8QKY2_9HELO|nr:hypothetical protein BP6252_11882 [Coleophoma cylindrospora]
MSPGNFFTLLQEISQLTNKQSVRQWSEIVQSYSRRSLTFRKDKLVAISGLARILAHVYGTNYVAGLWVKDLLRLLAWHVHTSDPSVAKNYATTYRAPSWSWASVDDAIVYPDGFAVPLEGDYADHIDDLKWPPIAKVLEAVTTYPEDQFGEVTSGFIRLRVQTLFRATINIKEWLRNRHFPVHILGLGTIKQFTAYPDNGLKSIEG